MGTSPLILCVPLSSHYISKTCLDISTNLKPNSLSFPIFIYHIPYHIPTILLVTFMNRTEYRYENDSGPQPASFTRGTMNSTTRKVKRPRRKDGNSTHVLPWLRMHGATPPVPHSIHGARHKYGNNVTSLLMYSVIKKGTIQNRHSHSKETSQHGELPVVRNQ